ncbi:MAG TPA: sigma factor-like helix-turn-helix DNA-binding protein, partial [Vicinamibacterales bacterium]
TMKQIGSEIGVNESRVSQLHARAIQRLRKTLGADCSAEEAARALRPAVIAFQQSQRALQARLAARARMDGAAMGGPARTDVPAVVLPYKKAAAKPAPKRRPVSGGRAIAAAR